MKNFQIEIIESGHKIVEIKAPNEDKALKIAREKYECAKIRLDAGRESIVDFYIL